MVKKKKRKKKLCQNECNVHFTYKNRELGIPLERTTYHHNLQLPFEYNAIKQTKIALTKCILSGFFTYPNKKHKHVYVMTCSLSQIVKNLKIIGVKGK